jgi:hypothetical protein
VIDDLIDLFDRQHLRQRFDILDAHLSECLPVSSARASVEALNATVGDSQ